MKQKVTLSAAEAKAVAAMLDRYQLLLSSTPGSTLSNTRIYDDKARRRASAFATLLRKRTPSPAPNRPPQSTCAATARDVPRA